MADATRTAPRPATRSAPRPAFRADLEGLRAVAVALVVADHLAGAPAGGFVGVDVFFVLSGFLITTLLLREADRTGTVSLHDFYVRRARRILPAAVLVVLVTVVVSAVVFLHNRTLQVVWDAVASLLFVQNWHLIRASTSYFADDGSSSPLQHYWSLSVEEQFYILWPAALLVVVVLARRFHVRYLVPLTVLLALATAASFAVSTWESAATPARSYFSIEARAWELGLGALAAIALPRLLPLARRAGSAISTTGVVLVLASALVVTPSLPFPAPWALLPVIGTLAVVVGGSAGPTRGTGVLTNPVSRYVGRISYSVYLWHYPAIVVIAALLPHRPVLAAVTAGVGTLVLAAATRRWVELPFLTRGHGRGSGRTRGHGRGSGRTDGRPAPAPTRRHAAVPGPAEQPRRHGAATVWSAVAVALVLVVSSAVQLRGPGWIVSGGAVASAAPVGTVDAPTDRAALERAVADAAASTTWPSTLTPSPGTVNATDSAADRYQRDGCLNDPVGLTATRLATAAATCTFGSGSAGHTVVVLGDSIAVSWLPAVVASVPRGWSVTGIGLESCPAVAVTVHDRLGRAAFPAACDAMRRAALAEIARTRPDVVLLSSAMGAITAQSSGATGTAAARALSTATTRTVRDLHASGSRVAVLTSPPESTPASACAVRPLGPSSCLASPSSDWERKAGADLAGVAATGLPSTAAVAIDTRRWFCTADGACPAYVGDTLVKADAGHLTTRYSRSLAPVLGAALAPVAPA